MDTIGHHELAQLFEQLGLDSSAQGIAHFVLCHRLVGEVALPDAPFWNESQAAFLRQALSSDAEWTDAVDKLAALLSPVR